MASHILAKDILAKIIIEKIPFALVLKTVFKQADLEKEDRSITSALVGCALRHYLVAERLIKDTYPSIDNSGLMAVLVALSNALFIKKLIKMNVIHMLNLLSRKMKQRSMILSLLLWKAKN